MRLKDSRHLPFLWRWIGDRLREVGTSGHGENGFVDPVQSEGWMGTIKTLALWPSYFDSMYAYVCTTTLNLNIFIHYSLNIL
jgi:hypothetical protein